jgi:hypothetical protein
MADTKISALTAVTTPVSTDEFPVNQGGTSKKVTLATLISFFQKMLSGSSGAANLNVGGETWQVLSADAATNSTTTIADVLTMTGIAAGTYWFRFDIICQSAATTTAVKFSVRHTGTVVRMLYHLFYPSQGVTASTGTVDQDINVTTGAVVSHESTRTNNTTLGPMTDVDTANADVHFWIEGMMEISASGSLVLGHASEVAAASTVKKGTHLYLKRLA